MPSSFTPAQLAFFAEQTRKAAKAAVRRYRREAMVGFAILFGAFGYVLHDTSSVNLASREAIVQSGAVLAVDGCNRDFNSITRLRTLLIRAQNQVTASARRGEIPQGAAVHARDFYSRELHRLPLPDCRKAKNILTDDPDKPIRHITPLHP